MYTMIIPKWNMPHFGKTNLAALRQNRNIAMGDFFRADVGGEDFLI